MSVNLPVSVEGATAPQLAIQFAIVNDGTSPLDANALFGASELWINGVPVRDWPFLANNGIRDPSPVPPGRAMSLVLGLGNLFEKPGTYTVSWSIPGYKAADITLRVLSSN